MGWVYYLHDKLGLDYVFDEAHGGVHRDNKVLHGWPLQPCVACANTSSGGWT